MKRLNALAYEQAPSESGKKNSARKANRLASPDRSRLAPLAIDLSRLARTKPIWEPVRKLERYEFHGDGQEASHLRYTCYFTC